MTILTLRRNGSKQAVGIKLLISGAARRLPKPLASTGSRKCLSLIAKQQLSITVTHCKVTRWSGCWRTRNQNLNEKRSRGLRSRPLGDQRQICVAPGSFGESFSLHDLAR